MSWPPLVHCTRISPVYKAIFLQCLSHELVTWASRPGKGHGPTKVSSRFPQAPGPSKSGKDKDKDAAEAARNKACRERQRREKLSEK